MFKAVWANTRMDSSLQSEYSFRGLSRSKDHTSHYVSTYCPKHVDKQNKGDDGPKYEVEI